MIYPDSFEVKTGFDQVRRWLSHEALGPGGRELAQQMRISTKVGVVNKWLAQTSDYLRMVQEGKDMLRSHYEDFSIIGKKLEIEGAYLVEAEWLSLSRILDSLEGIYRFTRSDAREVFTHLHELALGIADLQPLQQRIRQVFDDAGQIRDTASTELQRLRRMMLEEQRALRKKLDSILRQAQRDGYAPEGSEITVRSGRLVIPIVAEYKRRVKGFVHDESSTGHTVFMEPGEVLEANNLIRELEYEERREILRILQQLTDVARQRREDLVTGYQKLSLLDFIRAKAKFGMKHNCIRPEVSAKAPMQLIRARNLVLEETLRPQGRETIPLDLKLDEVDRILVISGPNAGGKSVALKTVAQVQYLIQFGLLAPVSEGTQTRVFERFFIDIGDDQSMENDLSTYSSHLRHMRHFLQNAQERSLVLIDEFGTGTDPAYGGPIAASVLEELNRNRVMGVITTHFSHLKDLATRTEGMVNGFMRFDIEHLAPLFELQMGKPGSSFALEIAQKNGLPTAIIQQAKAQVGVSQISADKLLVDLERERLEVDRLSTRLRQQGEITNKLMAEYDEIKTYLEENRKVIMNEAKQQAKDLVQEANRRIEETIRDIRESEAEKELTKISRQELKQFAEKELVMEKIDVPEAVQTKSKARNVTARNTPPPPPELLSGPIAVGDTVRMEGSENSGIVLEVKGKNARVSMGGLTVSLKTTQLQKLRAQAPPKAESSGMGIVRGLDINQKLSEFSHSLDVRGLYSGDALTQTEQYMDDAILLGTREVRIVHGKGNGVLKTQIRQFLKKYKEIESLEYDHADRGGEGVSIITFKV